MATPMTPDQLLAALRAEGLDVYEVPGWRDRCRCHDGSHERGERPTRRGWGPINGVTLHITTGAAATGQAAIDYCGYLVRGRPEADPPVPGPLCQITVDGDGRVLLVAAGRSNHVGSISQAALDAMIGASFSLTGSQNLRGSTVDGNTHTYGVEIMATTTPSPIQVVSAEKVAAAICRFYGWTGQETHGHGEVSSARGFGDPNLDMGAVRRDVMIRVGAPSSGGAGGGLPTGTVPPPPPPPAPSRPQVSVSRTAAAFRRDSQPSTPTGSVSYPPVVYVERALAAKGLLDPRWVDGSGGSRTVTAYAALQRSYGYTGRDADGIPGTASMTRLAHETGLFDPIA